MKKLISTLFVGILLTQGILTAFATTFSDVDTSYRYGTAVEYIAGMGVINGHPDGSFKPNDTLNRAELLKILITATKSASTIDEYKERELTCFQDIDPTAWYAPYVCMAKDLKWVKGYNDGAEFRPAQTVTFVEALKMTEKALPTYFSGIEGVDEFVSDVWYREYVERAEIRNLIPFDVNGFQIQLKRGQMTDLLARVFKEAEGELDDYLGVRQLKNVTFDTLQAGRNLANEPYDELEASMFEEDTTSSTSGSTALSFTDALNNSATTTETTTDDNATETTEVTTETNTTGEVGFVGPTRQYEIVLTNISDQQEDVTMPLSQALIVAHSCTTSLIIPGWPPYEELEPLAEWGDVQNAKAMFSNSDSVYGVSVSDIAMEPGEVSLANITVPSDVVDNACISALMMAYGSNDGVVLAEYNLATGGEKATVTVYDAGTEENSEINSGVSGGQPSVDNNLEQNMIGGTPTAPWSSVKVHPQFTGFDPIVEMTVSEL